MSPMTTDRPTGRGSWAGQVLARKNGERATLFSRLLRTAHASRLQRHALLIWRDAAAAAAPAAPILEAVPPAQQAKLSKGAHVFDVRFQTWSCSSSYRSIQLLGLGSQLEGQRAHTR